MGYTLPIVESMETSIEITEGLGGNVKVSITIRGVTTVSVWKMTYAEAMAEAEEIIRRKGG